MPPSPLYLEDSEPRRVRDSLEQVLGWGVPQAGQNVELLPDSADKTEHGNAAVLQLGSAVLRKVALRTTRSTKKGNESVKNKAGADKKPGAIGVKMQLLREYMESPPWRLRYAYNVSPINQQKTK